VLAATTDFALVYDAGDRWLVGCDKNAALFGDHAAGAIDDVRIYDRALGEDEIASLATE
jgi:hypothetical protein